MYVKQQNASDLRPLMDHSKGQMQEHSTNCQLGASVFPQIHDRISNITILPSFLHTTTNSNHCQLFSHELTMKLAIPMCRSR